MHAETAQDDAAFMRDGAGPVALLVCENDVFVAETADWLFERGFAQVAAFGPAAAALTPRPGLRILPGAPVHNPVRRAETLTRAIGEASGRWTLVCFNGEFLLHPFSDSRRIRDLTDFLDSERRSSSMAYAIDLYADSMIGGGVPALDEVYFDLDGWYGFEEDGRFVDIRGGLGWRFETHAPQELARINRPALFRARKGLSLDEDLWLSDPEMNAIACPWHNNPTVALMSFRRTRRILSHPDFRDVGTLMWLKSRRFEWSSDQLVHAGMIEAGQWL